MKDIPCESFECERKPRISIGREMGVDEMSCLMRR